MTKILNCDDITYSDVQKFKIFCRHMHNSHWIEIKRYTKHVGPKLSHSVPWLNGFIKHTFIINNSIIWRFLEFCYECFEYLIFVTCFLDGSMVISCVLHNSIAAVFFQWLSYFCPLHEDGATESRWKSRGGWKAEYKRNEDCV